jgi:sn-glycerol 3-phosphate transport system substrate-binding protein
MPRENDMWIRRFAAVAAAAALWAVATPAGAAVEIQWWHAMGGELGQKLEKIANDFNASQSDYKVVPVFKGSYPEAMTAAIAAFRARQNPTLLQVFEVGTATMMAAGGAVYPVFELMKDENEPFDPKAYLPAVTGYYSDTRGNMLSFPFNSSTPILYYNKDAFRKAGLDPNVAPRTWPEVEAAARKLQAAGLACGLTNEWPSWVMVENFSAFHNIPIGTKANGFGGLDTELTINNPLVEKQIAMLAEWQKTKLYDYGGRTNKAEPKFYAGECGIFIGSSAARLAILTNGKFDLGYGMQPYWPDVKGAPQNSIIGGATLWVLKGRPAAEYKGAAKFLAFLSKPETQAWWHQNTGYLPITLAAYELSRSQGFYDKNPGTDTAIKQMTLNPPTDNSKGLRFGSFVQIRDVIEEEMEQAFGGKKTAKEALDSAVKRGNDLLRQFEKANM